jgi:hypothetical protein
VTGRGLAKAACFTDILPSPFTSREDSMGRSGRACRGATLGAGIMLLLLAGAAQAYSPEQEQMCSGDAMRLCGADIPDVDRITACMIRQRAQLSPGCRAFFRDPEPPPAATPVAARKPLSIKPRSIKPREAKAPRRGS